MRAVNRGPIHIRSGRNDGRTSTPARSQGVPARHRNLPLDSGRVHLGGAALHLRAPDRLPAAASGATPRTRSAAGGACLSTRSSPRCGVAVAVWWNSPGGSLPRRAPDLVLLVHGPGGDIRGHRHRAARYARTGSWTSSARDRAKWRGAICGPTFSARDEVKFVVGDASTTNGPRCHQLADRCGVAERAADVAGMGRGQSGGDGGLDPQDGLPVRFQTQLHKHIWGADAKGFEAGGDAYGGLPEPDPRADGASSLAWKRSGFHEVGGAV